MNINFAKIISDKISEMETEGTIKKQFEDVFLIRIGQKTRTKCVPCCKTAYGDTESPNRLSVRQGTRARSRNCSVNWIPYFVSEEISLAMNRIGRKKCACIGTMSRAALPEKMIATAAQHTRKYRRNSV